jgi:ornithine cyclodeaminase/alanine dehydrogenase-like protein (mu-crystallin family)
MLYLSREDVFDLLAPDVCVQACDEGFKIEAAGEAEEVPRFHFDLIDQTTMGANWLRFMPSMMKTKGVVGLRIYGGRPLRFIYILWHARTGEPLVMMDAQAIRDVRTGAVGALGAREMSRPESSRIAVLGSGNQARCGLLAHVHVRKITQVKVFSPNQEHRERFARDLSPLINLEIEPVTSPQEAVRDTDIIITGSSRNVPVGDPVLAGEWLKPGMHVSSIGGRGEMDDAAILNASRIIIDTKQGFPHECRDVTDQVNKGLIKWDDMDELIDVMVGKATGRGSPEEITLLKTIGTSLQDLLPAAKTYELAVEKGRGKDLGDLFPAVESWYDMAKVGA